jgi:hypothetical protein
MMEDEIISAASCKKLIVQKLLSWRHKESSGVSASPLCLNLDRKLPLLHPAIFK